MRREAEGWEGLDFGEGGGEGKIQLFLMVSFLDETPRS